MRYYKDRFLHKRYHFMNNKSKLQYLKAYPTHTNVGLTRGKWPNSEKEHKSRCLWLKD